eukprot:jgi/Botrbrau1/2448/Bobra.0226s0007.1
MTSSAEGEGVEKRLGDEEGQEGLASSAERDCAICGEALEARHLACVCGAGTHLPCLAAHFLQAEGGRAGTAPTRGSCPACGLAYSWAQALATQQQASSWSRRRPSTRRRGRKAVRSASAEARGLPAKGAAPRNRKAPKGTSDSEVSGRPLGAEHAAAPKPLRPPAAAARPPRAPARGRSRKAKAKGPSSAPLGPDGCQASQMELAEPSLRTDPLCVPDLHLPPLDIPEVAHPELGSPETAPLRERLAARQKAGVMGDPDHAVDGTAQRISRPWGPGIHGDLHGEAFGEFNPPCEDALEGIPGVAGRRPGRSSTKQIRPAGTAPCTAPWQDDRLAGHPVAYRGPQGAPSIDDDAVILLSESGDEDGGCSPPAARGLGPPLLGQGPPPPLWSPGPAGSLKGHSPTLCQSAAPDDVVNLCTPSVQLALLESTSRQQEGSTEIHAIGSALSPPSFGGGSLGPGSPGADIWLVEDTGCKLRASSPATSSLGARAWGDGGRATDPASPSAAHVEATVLHRQLLSGRRLPFPSRKVPSHPRPSRGPALQSTSPKDAACIRTGRKTNQKIGSGVRPSGLGPAANRAAQSDGQCAKAQRNCDTKAGNSTNAPVPAGSVSASACSIGDWPPDEHHTIGTTRNRSSLDRVLRLAGRRPAPQSPTLFLASPARGESLETSPTGPAGVFRGRAGGLADDGVVDCTSPGQISGMRSTARASRRVALTTHMGSHGLPEQACSLGTPSPAPLRKRLQIGLGLRSGLLPPPFS